MPYTPGSEEGIPAAARQRLADMRAGGGKRGLFTSDLSVNEFVLVREAGFDPVGLVMGSSIFKLSANRGSEQDAGHEREATTKALYDARETAMARMEEEAEALGADGVIGVRLDMNLSMDANRIEWEQYRMWSEWSKEAGFVRPASVPP